MRFRTSPLRFGLTLCTLWVLGTACDHEAIPFACTDSSQCLFEGQEGLCEGSGFCSFPAPSCTGGRRYGKHADTDLVGACVPARKCGDGRISIGEECDDGNQIDNDGCTSACVRCGSNDGDARAAWDRNASCYVRYDRGTDWPAAAEICAVGGGHLVAPTSVAEHDFLVASVAAFGGPALWLGLSDRAERGSWVWVTREPAFLVLWRGGRPDMSVSDAHCGQLVPRASGGVEWVPRVCTEKVGFVCENPPWHVLPRTRRAYKLIHRSLSWEAARLACIKFGGHLATLTSSEEHDFVIQNFFGRYWLGATDQVKEGEFKWVTGERWRYLNFAPTEPDDSNGQQHCLDMGEDRRWHDNVCDVQQRALCELD